jgi:hypothetical protein
MNDRCVHCDQDLSNGVAYRLVGPNPVCEECMARLMAELDEADAAMADEYDDE